MITRFLPPSPHLSFPPFLSYTVYIYIYTLTQVEHLSNTRVSTREKLLQSRRLKQGVGNNVVDLLANTLELLHNYSTGEGEEGEGVGGRGERGGKGGRG